MTRAGNEMHVVQRLLLLVIPVMFLTGCATSALWSGDHFVHYRVPAVPVNLRLFQSGDTQDVLVQYDEWRDSKGPTRSRAFWLDQNEARVKEQSRPRFVGIAKAQGLSSIPIIEPAAFAGPPHAVGYYAIAANYDNTFKLERPGHPLQAYELPAYVEGSGRVKQVLLTPFAVAADVSIFGAFLVILCCDRDCESDHFPDWKAKEKPHSAEADKHPGGGSHKN